MCIGVVLLYLCIQELIIHVYIYVTDILIIDQCLIYAKAKKQTLIVCRQTLIRLPHTCSIRATLAWNKFSLCITNNLINTASF